MSVIEKLFFGEINISDESPPERDEEIQKQMEDRHEQFCMGLTKEQEQDLDSLISLVLCSTVDDIAYSFRRGFEIGFLLSEELSEAKNKMKRMDQEEPINESKE